MADCRGQPLRGRSFRPAGSVEAQREPDDDAVRLVAAGGAGHPARQGLIWLGLHGRERLRDCLGRVAQREADALRPRIYRQNPQPTEMLPVSGMRS